MKHLPVLALLVLAGPGRLLAMDAEERLLFANGLYRRDLYELAVPEYQALMTNQAASQMHDLAAFRLGECQRLLGRTNEAVAAYDVVIQHFPQGAFAHRAAFRRAQIDWNSGRLREAADRFQHLLAGRPEAEIEAASLYHQGLSLRGLDRFEEAEAALQRMVNAHPESPYADFARLELAGLLEQRRAPATEAAALYAAVAAQPETPGLGAEALARGGRLAYSEGNRAEASRLFSELATRYPEDPWNATVRLDAAWAHLLSGQLPASRTCALAGLQASGAGEKASWLYVLANLERKEGHNDEARRRYDELLSTAPADPLAPVAAYEGAGLAFDAGDHARVLALVALAEGSDGRELPLLWMKSVSLRELGRDDEAAVFFRRIVDEHPESDKAPAAAYQLALAEDIKGNLAAAAAAFLQLAARYPGSGLAPDALMASASAHLRSGQTQAAINAWNQLISDHPGYVGLDEAWIGRARAEVQLHQDDAAAQTLETLIGTYTNSRFLAEAHYLRGTLFEKQEAYDRADSSYAEALQLQPPAAMTRQVQYRRVAVLQRVGRAQEAADLLNRLLAEGLEEPLPSPLLEWLARWNLEQKAYPEAETAGRRLEATGENPIWKQVGAFVTGVAAREQKKVEEAVRAFTSAAGYGLQTRETAEAFYQLGLIDLDGQNFEAATGHFRQAAERSATDTTMDIRARSYLQLGIAEEGLQRWSEAGRYYLSVGVLFDDPVLTPESLYRAAGVLQAGGQEAERDRILDELRERFPENEWTRRADEKWPEQQRSVEP